MEQSLRDGAWIRERQIPLWHCQTVGLSRLLPMILLLGLWLLCTLPAPRLFLDRLSAHQGDTAMLSCLVPLDTPMTRIIFCKDGKEISVQPKEGNKLVYDSPYTVSRESAGTFSCRYQLKDDNNQENNSLSSDPWDLHVDGGDGSGGDAWPQGKWFCSVLWDFPVGKLEGWAGISGEHMSISEERLYPIIGAWVDRRPRAHLHVGNVKCPGSPTCHHLLPSEPRYVHVASNALS
ncbi:unnamed protein product [Lepidochelys kempii]